MSRYFKFKKDWEELKNNAEWKDRAAIVSKIAGKGLANVGIFTVTELIPGVAKEMMDPEFRKGLVERDSIRTRAAVDEVDGRLSRIDSAIDRGYEMTVEQQEKYKKMKAYSSKAHERLERQQAYIDKQGD